MPVLFDSGGQNGTASGATGTWSDPHNVNTLASDVCGLVTVLWIGTGSTTSGTITVKWGEDSMTPEDPFRWGNNMFQGFRIEDQAKGRSTITVTCTNMGGSGYFIFSHLSYSGVDSIGTVVKATPTSTGNNSVTVSSVAPAYKVVTAHAVGQISPPNSFYSYSNTLRSNGYVYLWPAIVSQILMGDAPGATSVTTTCPMAGATNAWGAYGWSLSPAPVVADAALDLSMDFSAEAGLYRVGSVAPSRLWVIEN
jgi:hypothetical protein